MALYVDSAVRLDVEHLFSTGLFRGLTTNPTILAKAGLRHDDLPQVYDWATTAGADVVFMQVLGNDANEMVESGRRLRAIGQHVTVKVPATRAGLTAARVLASDGASVLLTAVYAASQALLASAAGAHYIAPYVGRITDKGRDGLAETVLMQRILANDATRVLAASLRAPEEVAVLAAEGVDDFTLNTALCEAMLADPDTIAATNDFAAAWD